MGNRLIITQTFFISGIFGLILLSFNSVYAYEVIYPVLDYKHNKIPNYCILRSSDPQFNDAQKDWMVKVAQDAVKEWETTLQKSSPYSYKWQMMSMQIQTKDQSQSFNCDWIISFEVEISSFFGKVLGYADIEKQDIVITFKELNPEQFHDVLLHEIGHSLGLGHFTTDDPAVMENWLTSESPPSIMIPNIHQNPGLTYITDVDINKVKSIYGTGGFLGKYEKEIDETKVEPLTPLVALETLSVSPKTISIQKHQNNIVTIYGKLKKDYVLSGVPFHLVIIRPDLKTEVLSLYPTSNGVFQAPLMYDEKSPKGEYSIEGVYRDRTVNYKPVKYLIVDENYKPTILESKTEKTTHIPPWVKNNAKWWSENLIEDQSFVRGIEYLIKEKIIFVPNLSAKTSSATEIPKWIKDVAGWWANGKLSDDEFLKGIQYLIQQGIIRV